MNENPYESPQAPPEEPTFTYQVFDRVSNRDAELQSSITEQLALLGNRIGDEFQRELRVRISDLHQFQEQSFSEAAHRDATQIIPILW